MALCVRWWQWVVLGLFVCLRETTGVADELSIVVPQDVLHDYEQLRDRRAVATIDDYSGLGSRRDTVEIILLQQAFLRAGVDEPVRFITADSYSRILRLLQSGEALAGGTSVWAINVASVQDAVALSDELIPDGKFEAGFYTTANNATALRASTLNDIQALHIVANPAWTVDWQTLNQLGIRHLEATPQWNSMVRMVLAHRVDALLAPFQNRVDLSLRTEFGVLYPIPGIKIALKGARFLPVSLKHPRGMVMLSALNQGLKKLRDEGRIERAYRQSGFYNQQVKNWRRLN